MAKWNVRNQPGGTATQVIDAQSIQYSDDGGTVIFYDKESEAVAMVKIAVGMVVDKA